MMAEIAFALAMTAILAVSVGLCWVIIRDTRERGG